MSIVLVKKLNNTKIAGVNSEKTYSSLSGLVLPHHELAKELIIKTLSVIKANQDFKYIVVIGPNHFRPESECLASTEKLKNFRLASEYFEKLKNSDIKVDWDETLLANEHSVNIPISYLYNYFPEAKFIPIIVSLYCEEKKLLAISDWLAKTMPANTLYVAGVDFSHGKMWAEALHNNEETINVISHFDYQKLYSFKDDYLDSPASMAILMMLMEKLNKKSWETWYSSHGALITGQLLNQSTGYVIGTFK